MRASRQRGGATKLQEQAMTSAHGSEHLLNLVELPVGKPKWKPNVNGCFCASSDRCLGLFWRGFHEVGQDDLQGDDSGLKIFDLRKFVHWSSSKMKSSIVVSDASSLFRTVFATFSFTRRC
jgi:hypothetical protein